ncbi:50S ribosomal protein L12 [Pyrus ussuriensis x Pyrus communis]|uniref:50S ribosomal protein L12 n=1 Tax=Pyrus ussuriensis x Pyrus communis TaxID=2448454 RepID=A0A5N5ICE5_9ROSA|nr:50S ribosomal protein L12 [Pyrus ussuriensis x Pyrus communis]
MASFLQCFSSHARLSRTTLVPRSKPFLVDIIWGDLPVTTTTQQGLGLKMGLNRYGLAISSIGSASSDSGPASIKSKVAKKIACDIKIEKFDTAAKIKIIKEVRTFTELGLKEAKELVDKVPVVVKKGLTKVEEETIVDKLKELGAIVIFYFSMVIFVLLFRSSAL